MLDSRAMTHSLFATTPRGMNDLLAEEIRAFGGAEVSEARGGVAFSGDLECAYRTCLWSRIANRVLLAISRFPAPDTDALYEGARTIDWLAHLDGTMTFAIDVTLSSARIDHSHFAALRIKDAIVDGFVERTGERPSVDTQSPDIRFNCHIHREEATLYVDLSGNSLHQRGYRLSTGAAPLKENLAAAILMRAKWPEICENGGSLVDPMCGSGTLVLEAAQMAADIAPGLLRPSFGFSRWPKHHEAIWTRLLAEAGHRREVGLRQMPSLMGFDADRRVLDAARDNAARLGLEDHTRFAYQDIADFRHDFPREGLLVCNPPYGKRLMESGELPALYQHLGNVMKSYFEGWRAAVYTEDPDLGKAIGMRAARQNTLYNGAIACRLIHFEIEPANYFRYDRLPARISTEELSTQAGDFRNRLQKNERQLGKWTRREHVACYRVYDADLPDYAVAIDVYRHDSALDQPWLSVQEYEPPKQIDARKARRRLREVRTVVQDCFEVSDEQLFFKVRARQRGSDQYEKLGAGAAHVEVSEGPCRVLVNFEDYLDTGLFLDHRPIRFRLGSEAAGKRFLNLFCYTGVATLHAALGGASSSLSVDMSATYLDWARKNFQLNGIDTSIHELHQADCLQWLDQANERFDLIFLDPPTFSNSKRMKSTLDVQRDHAEMIQRCMALLARGGALYFSTNLRQFRLDEQVSADFSVEDITRATIPPDFSRHPKIHHCFRIT